MLKKAKEGIRDTLRNGDNLITRGGMQWNRLTRNGRRTNCLGTKWHRTVEEEYKFRKKLWDSDSA